MNRVFGSVAALLAIGALAMSVSGCGENPVTPNEHFEARGLVLSIDGTEIVRVDSGRVTGRLDLRVGDTTQRFVPRFIDADGDLVVPNSTPDQNGRYEYEVVLTMGDSTIASVVRNGSLPIRGFRLRGAARGSTTLELRLLHEGHDDFRSPLIPVVVSQ